MSSIVLIFLLILIIIIVILIIKSKTRVAGIILAVIVLAGFGTLAYINSRETSPYSVDNIRKFIKNEHYVQIEQRAINIDSFDSNVLKSIDLLRFQKDKVKLSIYITEYTSYDDSMSESAYKIQRELFRNLGYCQGSGGGDPPINIQVCSETNSNKEVDFIFNKITGHQQ